LSAKIDVLSWPYTLYVEHPELYLPFLLKDEDLAEEEVSLLLRLFECNFVARRAKILDLSCGIGRHSINLAKRGYKVVGYDLSPMYVEQAEVRAITTFGSENRLRFYQGEAAEADKVLSRQGEKEFDVIMIMGNSLGFFNDEYDSYILRSIANIAAEGCVLIIQTENRDWRIRNFQPFIDIAFEKIEVIQKWSLSLESSTATGLCRFYELQPGKSLKLLLNLRMALRLYSLHELIRMLNSTGWSYLASYGSSSRLQSAEYDDEHIITVGKKQT
jgi:SAM-dependent methyltransferase